MAESAPAAPPAEAARRTPLRVLAGLLMLALMLSLVVGAHHYVARRFFLDPAWPGWLQTAGVAAVAALFVGFFAQPILERRMRPPRMRWLSLPVVCWMGVLWLSLVGWGLADGIGWLMGLAAEPGAEVARARALGVGAAVLAASALGLRQGLSVPRVKRVEVRIARWPAALEGFRIAQISDIHIGPVLDRRFAAGLTERVNGLDADLVAVTGDLVDGTVDQLAEDVAPFAGLRGRHGVFFVTGNHDVYSGDVAWVEKVRALGMRVLRNERVAIGGTEGFDLAGVDDHRGDWRGASTEDLPAALEGRDPARPVVLLAHDPGTFPRAARLGVDLQISGHTHGGQIWPFHWLVRLSTRFVAGLYREGGSQIYVSRGSGFWGPPMRLGAPAEVTEITLRAA